MENGRKNYIARIALIGGLSAENSLLEALTHADDADPDVEIAADGKKPWRKLGRL